MFCRSSTHKSVGFKRLREILDSINPNVVKEVKVIPKGSQSFYISSFDIEVGYSKYNLWVADMDPRYTDDGIILFRELLLDYKDIINFNITEYRYKTQGQSCSDNWIFKI